MSKDIAEVSGSTAGLIGLALRSREVACGFSSAKRMISNSEAAFVLMDSEVAKHTSEKLEAVATANSTQLIRVNVAEQDNGLQGLTGYKILAFPRGNLASGIFKKLKQENPWL